jgi:hypothetical protein
MLRVSPARILLARGQESERTIMGNVTVAGELAGSDELDELFKLEASESAPEDDDEDDDLEDDDEDDDLEDDDDGGEPFEPKDIPHG